jgi:hypothetical protein
VDAKRVVYRARKSLRLCLAGLRIWWLDPIAEASELPDHSLRALLLWPLGDGWAAFFVTDSLVQDSALYSFVTSMSRWSAKLAFSFASGAITSPRSLPLT